MPNYVLFYMERVQERDFQINILYCEVLGNESKT